MKEIKIYNTLTREKEVFKPLHAPTIGMYVCGPTVYGDPHLGHARPAITFDIIFRYLTHIGYKVRYVRNITDVGHLEHDADDGEDKIAVKARLEKLEPMEIAQHYTNVYQSAMRDLNVLPPSIEPRASGHIIEQIELVEKLLEKGYAYESNGSVYFDIKKYSEKYKYGELSGRVLDDLLEATRNLDGQQEKRQSADFALWKKAAPEHIMRWNSPWSVGFPGWHLECSAMSVKYLGEEFDIHGGGMDLLFPHHECEIAQNTALQGKPSVRYWIHNNMITIDNQKMGKSLGNFITLEEMFAGTNKNLEKEYTPMTIRFFILQAQYRGTLDFSNTALQAAEKGLERLMNAVHTIKNIKPSNESNVDLNSIKEECYNAMNDDFNTPIAISKLFDAVRIINTLNEGKASISEKDLTDFKEFFGTFVFDILGLKEENTKNDNSELTSSLIELMLNMRQDAKLKKDFAASDKIRNDLKEVGVIVKDTNDGSEWTIE